MNVDGASISTDLGRVLRETSAAASSAMAHSLAHRINNPLQSITNSIFLAMHSADSDARALHLEQASEDLHQLSLLVGNLLSLHGPLPIEVSPEHLQ